MSRPNVNQMKRRGLTPDGQTLEGLVSGAEKSQEEFKKAEAGKATVSPGGIGRKGRFVNRVSNGAPICVHLCAKEFFPAALFLEWLALSYDCWITWSVIGRRVLGDTWYDD